MNCQDGNDSAMDAVDRAQQDALDKNKVVDECQQDQIDRLMANRTFIFATLVINAIGSLFQILECLKVYWSLH